MAYFNFESKKVYYKIKGEGKPILLLHGYAASSKMFHPVIDLHKKHYKIILINFSGSVKSDRLSGFEKDYYFTISSFCTHITYRK